jgi:hypothetical protein
LGQTTRRQPFLKVSDIDNASPINKQNTENDTNIPRSSDGRSVSVSSYGQCAHANPGIFPAMAGKFAAMGSIVPSSDALCQRIVRNTQRTGDELVIELGAGTGVISCALLEGGSPRSSFFDGDRAGYGRLSAESAAWGDCDRRRCSGDA